jgi:hypothetical protein
VGIIDGIDIDGGGDALMASVVFVEDTGRLTPWPCSWKKFPQMVSQSLIASKVHDNVGPHHVYDGRYRLINPSF